jgi:hypothetical protein
MRAKPSLALASVLVSALAALSVPADAACKKFGFTVNDYGKEGPTNDAKNLLDKHIGEWAAKSGVAEYQTGKKSVSCELFLDVILFDEHTCTASATVCWGAGVKPNNKTGEQTAEATTEESGEAPPAPVSKAEALGIPPQQQTAAATTAPADAAPAAGEAAPAEQAAAPATEAPAAAPAAPETPPAAAQATPPPSAPASAAPVETGTLQAGVGMAEKKAAPAVSEKDRAAAAAAAASAAAAAERAAVAAETAANAAKEAAAAAVAASAASKSTATVPPLDHASGAKPAHNE